MVVLYVRTRRPPGKTDLVLRPEETNKNPSPVLPMYRSQYDTDITIFSPAGRLHQVEYAMEAVKQGSATVGVRSNTHAVIVSLKRTASELASYQVCAK